MLYTINIIQRLEANKMNHNKLDGKKQFLAGIHSGLPVIFGFIPIGMAYAIMAKQAGFTGFETVLMSVFVFAGASQMMVVGMYAQGASLLAMILTTLILNFRHVIMSTCIMKHLKEESILKKLLASFGVTDESFAILTTKNDEDITITYFFGLIITTYSSWIVGAVIGTIASSYIPKSISASFGIALYAMFIGLLVPNLRKNYHLTILIVLTAIVNTILTQFMASSWALILSTLTCTFIGVFFVDLNHTKEHTHES